MNHIDPEVTIGIPTLNGPDRLRRCLRAIKLNTPSTHRFKVLVVDDRSTPENLQKNKDVIHSLGVEMLTHEERLGVAAGWNHLSRHTQAPYVILMNDDVEVVPDWYEAMVFSLKNNSHAGMIGLKSFQGLNSLNYNPPPALSYNEAKLEHGVGMIAATGFLFGFERKKFDEVNGFDENFFLFYEEVDFGLRLLEKGYPSYMLTYPIVLHQGGATTSDTRNVPDTNAVLLESREYFIKKHKGTIDEIRSQLKPQIYPRMTEWNTMLKTWVH